MKKLRTIVLWGRDDLLSSSVELYLTAQNGWKVVSLSNDENLAALIQAVDKVHPHVVIIQLKDCVSQLNLPSNLLRDHPGLKVIVVNPDDNTMEVYGKQNVLIQSVSDFTTMIETDLFQTIEQDS